MKKESLEEAILDIINMLDKKEMDLLEKIELMNNLRLFLNPYKYEENVRILEKRRLDENNIYPRR